MAGEHVWWGCAWQGVCMAEGGHAWHGGMHGGGACVAGVCMAGGPACVAGETTTVADGTHPTGMHSCLQSICTIIFHCHPRNQVTKQAMQFPRSCGNFIPQIKK